MDTPTASYKYYRAHISSDLIFPISAQVAPTSNNKKGRQNNSLIGFFINRDNKKITAYRSNCMLT